MCQGVQSGAERGSVRPHRLGVRVGAARVEQTGKLGAGREHRGVGDQVGVEPLGHDRLGVPLVLG